MRAPKFSIVTPSYGQLDWLELALASVADQAGVEVEHIVQDAGTSGIEAMFDGKAHRARASLYVEKDAGMYDAINRGLRRASGDVCAYLNCDEQYLPGTLQKVAHFFVTHPEVEVLFGDVVLVDPEGRPLSYRRTVSPTLSHLRAAHLNTASCAMFFRRAVLERGFYFETKWKAIGDLAWVEALLAAGVRVQAIPEPLAVFSFTGKNLGATALSEEEINLWRGSISPLRAFQSASIVMGHRVRKAFAGAYRARRVDIAIYTLAHPDRRERRVAEGVGYSWPESR